MRDVAECRTASACSGEIAGQRPERCWPGSDPINLSSRPRRKSIGFTSTLRANEISFEQLTAFTITDDHARQVDVWQSLSPYNRHHHTIKRMLASEEVPASDKRAQFIGGLDAIGAEGGTVRRDLFDPEDGGCRRRSGIRGFDGRYRRSTKDATRP
ncbi:hypothetical protein V6617_18835 (plasmid) [Pelagibacterium nitratireducens]|jgi:hypothetical protein|uniref:Tn3 transposase DDE domain-containing protein n=1 Tax=Pelagibacterium nitratireducens TaxID=1046114 RepID=A0ABZ2I8I4_9HYPH|tara:strand:+ start:3116 stop:3583 length:468 start_codon:yes stop_codon:yes gene_type:complete